MNTSVTRITRRTAAGLTDDEVQRLAVVKARRALRLDTVFAAAETRRLVFLRHLRLTGRIGADDDARAEPGSYS